MEVVKDYIHPGDGGDNSAAYKWVAAKGGKIKITGEYVKFANSDDVDADGVCMRIIQNGEERGWFGDGIHAKGITSDVSVSIDKELDVSAGDAILFVVSPEDNNKLDGGRLSIIIKPSEESVDPDPEPNPNPDPEPNPDPDRTTNEANLYDDFKNTQGNNGWHYGTATWDGKGFKEIAYDEAKAKYAGDG